MRLKGNTVEQQIRWASLIAFAVALFLMWNPSARAQQDDMKDMPGMDMQGSSAPETPAMLAKHARDKKESEFNHHLAGAGGIGRGVPVGAGQASQAVARVCATCGPAVSWPREFSCWYSAIPKCGRLEARASGMRSPIIRKICSTRRSR